MNNGLEETARSMLDDLRAFRLDVVLAPARYGDGMVRIVQGKNPPWYRELCARHTSTRVRRNKRHDTSIKRARVYHALECMVRGWRFTYHREELIALVEQVARGEFDERETSCG